MAPPSMQGVKNRVGFVTVDESIFREIFAQTVALPSGDRFEFGPEKWEHLFKSFFQTGSFRSCLRLHRLDVPIARAPDLSIAEGARVCMDGRFGEEAIRLKEPITMQGFSTLFGSVRIDRIRTGKNGRIEAANGCLVSEDISGFLQNTPVGDLLPEGRLRPIPYHDLVEAFTSIDWEAVNSAFSPFKDLVHEIGLKTEICPDPACSAPASLALYLDLSEFRKTLESGRFSHFDFSGILEGSQIDWPSFDLARLAGGDQRQPLKGVADLHWHYDPEKRLTEVRLKNLNLSEPIVLRGDVTVTLRDGGEIWVHLEKLSVEVPSLTLPQGQAGSFAAVVTGDLYATVDPVSRLPTLREASLDVTGLQLQTAPGIGIQWKESSLVYGTDLRGDAWIHYSVEDPEEPLRTEWNLSGTLWGKSIVPGSKQGFEIQNIRSYGEGAWRPAEGGLVPNPGHFRFFGTGDAGGTTDSGQGYSATRVWVNLEGTGHQETDPLITERAEIDFGAGELQWGGIAVVPWGRFSLQSLHDRRSDGYQVSGAGKWFLQSPIVALEGRTSFTTDLTNVEWSHRLEEPVVIGPFTLTGKMRIEGEGGGSAPSFRIITEDPYTVSFRDRPLASDISVRGGGAAGKADISIRAAKVLEGAAVSMKVRKESGQDRLFGTYRLSSAPMNLGEGLFARDGAVRGSFITPPTAEFLSNPRLFVSGGAETRLEGPIAGPLAADYKGTLRVLPDRSEAHLTFSPGPSSVVAWGPLSPQGIDDLIEGRADLQGTVIVKLDETGPHVQGRHVGIRNGKLYVALDGRPVPTQNGEMVPALSNLSFTADSFLGIWNGVAHSGGEGFRFETTIDLVPLGIGVDPENSKRKVTFVFDRLPVSVQGYWNLFRRAHRDLIEPEEIP